MTKNQFLDDESLEFHSSQSQSIAEQAEDQEYNNRLYDIVDEIQYAEWVEWLEELNEREDQ